MLYSVIIKEDSSCSRWEQTQRLTARHYTQRESETHSPKWDVSSKVLPSELRTLTEEETESMEEPEEMEDTKKTTMYFKSS